MKVTIVTSIPSPYQVEFFNALANRIELSVIFANKLDSNRPWEMLPLRFPSVTLGPVDEKSAASALCMDADLVVFNWYQDSEIVKWMQYREDARRPWVFWGERPGFKLPLPIGSWYRKFKLNILHRSRAPIWGIGSWAVERYRQEFGEARCYVNIPYFSDLSRFQRADESRGKPRSILTFLYSGKLNRRKGIDLTLKVAEKIFPRNPNFRLLLAGDGPLRPYAESVAAKFSNQIDVLGFVPWDRLPEVYARAKVLLAPSRYDGWNLAVPEGLAAGLPVVSTDQTGAALDLIRHGENGWIVRAGSHNDLIKAIDEAVNCDLPKFSSAAVAKSRVNSLEIGVELFSRAAEAACANS